MNGHLSSICQLSALFRCQYVVWNMHRWVSEGDDGNVVVIEVLMMMMTMAVTVEVVGERALGCFHFSQIEQFTLVTFGTFRNIQNLLIQMFSVAQSLVDGMGSWFSNRAHFNIETVCFSVERLKIRPPSSYCLRFNCTQNGCSRTQNTIWPFDSIIVSHHNHCISCCVLDFECHAESAPYFVTSDNDL